MKHLLALPLILGGLQVAAWADFVPAGTEIPVRADQPITVARWERGRIYPGHVSRDVRGRTGDIAIPRGSYAELIVRQVGPNQLALDLESVTVNGRRYVMDTSGPQFNANRGAYDNGAGIVGSIVGALTGVQVNGSAIQVPAGSEMRFHLDQGLRVVDWGDPGYMERGYHYHREHDWYR